MLQNINQSKKKVWQCNLCLTRKIYCFLQTLQTAGKDTHYNFGKLIGDTISSCMLLNTQRLMIEPSKFGLQTPKKNNDTFSIEH